MKVSTENKEWRKFEVETSKKICGKTTIGSGNTCFDKGDCKNQDWLIDTKTTESKSFSLKKDFFIKYKKYAEIEGKNFALPIRFIGKENLDLVVIDYNVFIEFLEYQKFII